MGTVDAACAPELPLIAVKERIIRKVFRRLIWFLLLLYIVSFLDRINIGFAALAMNRDLGLNATMFGLSSTIFYVGYLLFEVPSNLLLVRFGARRWLARIMITWGLAATATMFATGPYGLYAIRFVVGLAEAGFFPGVLLYLTYWFPRSDRARATALLTTAQPIAMALGGPLSGLILGMPRILDLAPWRWLFLMEGLPAVILGIVTFYYLPDRPATARWLGDAEKAALEGRIEREDAAGRPGTGPKSGHWAELRSLNILLLCSVYFDLVISLGANATWSPQIMREVLHGSSNFLLVGLMTAIPALCALAAMPLWGRLSDRLDKPVLFTILPMATAGLGWICVGSLDSVALRIFGLILGSVGSLAALSVFWTLPAACLSNAARPAGIALVSTVGISGAIVGPYVIGRLRDLTASYAASLWFVVAMLVLGCCLLRFVVPSRGGAPRPDGAG